jgi:hypothetical protein
VRRYTGEYVRVIALNLLGTSERQQVRTMFIDTLLGDFMQTAITESKHPREFFDTLIKILVPFARVTGL